MKNFRFVVAAMLSLLLLVGGITAFADGTWNYNQHVFYSPNPSAITTVTTNYTLLTTDNMVNVDASAGPVTITFPRIVKDGMAGKSGGYIIKKIDSTMNAVTLAAATNDSVTNTIEGKTIRVILAPNGIASVYLTGYDWKIDWETPPATSDMTTGEYSPLLGRIKLGMVTTPTVSTTFTQSDCGKTIAVGTDALTMTLPTAIVGCSFNFINVGVAGNNILDVKAGSTDAFYGTLYNPNGTSTIVTSSTGSTVSDTKATAQRGDSVSIFCPAATRWIITKNTGTWTTK